MLSISSKFILVLVGAVAMSVNSSPIPPQCDVNLTRFPVHTPSDPVHSNKSDNLKTNHVLFPDDSDIHHSLAIHSEEIEDAECSVREKITNRTSAIIQIAAFFLFIIMGHQTILKQRPLVFALMFMYGLHHHSVHSYSACDATDIYFLVDTASVKADSKGVIDLIDSVIDKGSSEESGYSVIIWGENVPDLQYGINNGNELSILCEISETAPIYNRPAQKAKINAILKDAFAKIKNARSNREIPFDDALDFAMQEAKADDREYFNRQAHGKSVGINDDQDVFVVFDYDNTLGKNEEIQEYIEEFKDDQMRSIHFIIGQSVHLRNDTNNNPEENGTVCHDPSENELTTHFFMFGPLINDIGNEAVHSMWDQFLDLTCPATIIVDEKGQKLGLGNHVQYLEPSTLISCDVTIDNETSEIDSTISFLTVRDELDEKSTATFNIGDYLFVDSNTYKELPEECAHVGSVKIIDSTIIEKPGSANILKLRIGEPDSLIEFITGGYYEGVVDPMPDDNYTNITDENDRRRMMAIGVGASWTIHIRDVYTKTGTYTKRRWKNGNWWTFESSGKITTNYDVVMTFYAGLYLRVDAGLTYWTKRVCWCWSPWSGWGCCHNIYIPNGFWFEFQVQLEGSYTLDAKLKISFEAYAKAHLPRLLYFSTDRIAWIGGVPVKYRPWFQVDLLSKTVPLHAEVKTNIRFGHRAYIGYEYKYNRCCARGAYIHGPSLTHRSYSYDWNIGAGNPTVPKKVGIDTWVDAIFGLDFYKSVSGQVIFEFFAPLYVELTSQDHRCNSWGSCNNNLKPAILTFKIDLQPMWRIAFSSSFAAQAAKAIAASILKVFGVSVDLSGITHDRIGHVNKNAASKIGGPIRLYTYHKCFDISSYWWARQLIPKYCTGYAHCPSWAYNGWAYPRCNGVSAKIGYNQMDNGDNFEDDGIRDDDDDFNDFDGLEFSNNSKMIWILVIGFVIAAILCCINVGIYIKQSGAVKYEKVQIYSSGEENNDDEQQ